MFKAREKISSDTQPLPSLTNDKGTFLFLTGFLQLILKFVMIHCCDEETIRRRGSAVKSSPLGFGLTNRTFTVINHFRPLFFFIFLETLALGPI